MRRIGDYTLRQLARQYERDIFKDFFPFLDKHVIDHELGGFMTNVDRDGTLLKTTKNTWYCGRGIWAYSFLYNNFDKRPEYLDIAEKAVRFIMRHPPEGDHLWAAEFTKEGEPIIVEGQFIGGKYYPVSEEVSGDLFIANGLAEYSKAAGDAGYWDQAKEIILKCVRIFDRPDYAPNAAQVYLGKDAPSLPGAQAHGRGHAAAERHPADARAPRRRRARRRERPGRRARSSTSTTTPNTTCSTRSSTTTTRGRTTIYRHLVYTGHAIETMWMLIYEALPPEGQEALPPGRQRCFKRHIEIAWDRVFGGFFRGLKDVQANLWILDKPLWTQEEVLIGTLFVIEHTGAEWAQEWFARTFAFVQDKYSLRKHGFSLYDDWPDRLVTFVPHHTRVEIFHHPRHLMQNLLSLRRLIERRGRPSGFLES